MKAKNGFIQLFLIDKAYGGPEEGGWWFVYGNPEEHPLNRQFDSEEDAFDFLESNRDEYYKAEDALNEGRNHDIDSVISEGRYVFMAVDSTAPFPESRPHYE